MVTYRLGGSVRRLEWFGGDGGGPIPQFPSIPIRVEFKDTPWSNSATKSWLRDRRLALGMSQSKLAKSLGVHVKTVQAWERGNSAPQSDKRQRLERLISGPVVTSGG